MPRSFRSFRSRMIVLLALSMGLAGLATYIAYKLLQAYYTSSVRFEDESVVRLRQVIRLVGDFNFFLLFFIPLAVLFFYALSSPYARYFQQISGGIRALAEGDFERRVEIRSGDEFQSIAEDLGQAGDKLRQAVRRGDFAESSKDQLVLNLAHDLRTPLTSVVGYLDYVLKDDGLTPEQTRHYLGIAASKAQRLERLIDELFEVTRLQHGQLPLERAELDLAELLSQLSEEMQPLFEKTDSKPGWSWSRRCLSRRTATCSPAYSRTSPSTPPATAGTDVMWTSAASRRGTRRSRRSSTTAAASSRRSCRICSTCSTPATSRGRAASAAPASACSSRRTSSSATAGRSRRAATSCGRFSRCGCRGTGHLHLRSRF